MIVDLRRKIYIFIALVFGMIAIIDLADYQSMRARSSDVFKHKLEYFSIDPGSFFYHASAYIVFLTTFLLTTFLASNAARQRSPRNCFSGTIRRNPLTTDFLIIIVLLILITKLTQIFSGGLFEYAIKVRLGEAELGGLFYIASIGGVLLYDFRRLIGRNDSLNGAFMLLFIMVNLLSGFRVLIIWALIYFGVSRLLSGKLKITWRLVFGSICFFLLFMTYEGVRAGLESGSLEIVSIAPWASLNRSAPITTMALIDHYGIRSDYTLAYMFYDAAIYFINYLNFDFQPTGYEIKQITEPLYRGWLIWRGTPTYEATGLSVNGVSVMWADGRVFGLILGGVTLGLLYKFASVLAVSRSPYRSISGKVLLSAIIFSNETASGAVTLALYSLTFCSAVFMAHVFVNALAPDSRR